MATAYVDRTTTLNMTENQGAVVQLSRVVRVVGLTGTDPQVLQNALDTTDVPAANSTPTGYTNLILLERNPSLVPGQKDVVDIALEYGPKSADERNFRFQVSAGFNQTSTQVDIYNNPISVQHTFPATDPDFPDETRVQGGDVPVPIAAIELVATGVIATDYPHWKAQEWIGALNSKPWAGGAAQRWACTSVSSVLFDFSQSPQEWKFTFHFQFDYTGWEPTVYYVDPRTGKPPPNLVSGVGIKTLRWYQRKDYNEQFPVAPVVV